MCITLICTTAGKHSRDGVPITINFSNFFIKASLTAICLSHSEQVLGERTGLEALWNFQDSILQYQPPSMYFEGLIKPFLIHTGLGLVAVHQIYSEQPAQEIDDYSFTAKGPIKDLAQKFIIHKIFYVLRPNNVPLIFPNYIFDSLNSFISNVEFRTNAST